MQFEVQELSGIQTLVIGPENAERAVILLHGFGANYHDLAPLWAELDPQHQFRWYFPNGPIQVPLGPGMMGQAWFYIDSNALERAMMTGIPRDFADSRPSGFSEAVDQINNFIKSLPFASEKIYLGGFSQGAMLSTEVVAGKKDFAGLIALSGNLVDEANLSQLLNTSNPVRIFQSHGTQDLVLGIEGAKRLNKLFIKYHHQATFLSFEGPHTIPEEVLEKLRDWLKN